MPLKSRFESNGKIGITFVGNTLGLSKINSTSKKLDLGVFTALSKFTNVEGYPFGTTKDWRENASYATLKVPNNSKILHAELIWAGSTLSETEDVREYIDNDISFVTPKSVNFVKPDNSSGQTYVYGNQVFYMRSQDVTNIVSDFGEGRYTVKGVPGTVGESNRFLNSNTCGWTLVVVYENSELPKRYINLCIGFEGINNSNPQFMGILDGFKTPVKGKFDTRLALSVMNASPYLSGKRVFIGDDENDLIQLSGPNNNSNNFFASQINLDNGIKSNLCSFADRTPMSEVNLKGVRTGWDITNIDTSFAFSNSQEECILCFVTDGEDDFLVNAVALVVDIDNMNIEFTQSLDKKFLKNEEIIDVKYKITNNSNDDMNEVIFRNPAQMGIDYIKGSLVVDNITYSDIDVDSGVNLGLLPKDRAMDITFKIRVYESGKVKIKNSAYIDFFIKDFENQYKMRKESEQTNLYLNYINISLSEENNKEHVPYKEIFNHTLRIANEGNMNILDCVIKEYNNNNMKYIPLKILIDKDVYNYSDLISGIKIGDLSVGTSKNIILEIKNNNLQNNIQSLSNFVIEGKAFHENEYQIVTLKNEFVPPRTVYANIEISKFADKEDALNGDIINFNMSLKNNGNIGTSSVYLSNLIPRGTEFLENSLNINNERKKQVNIKEGLRLRDIDSDEVVNINYAVKIHEKTQKNIKKIIDDSKVSFKYYLGQEKISKILNFNRNIINIKYLKVDVFKKVNKKSALLGDNLHYETIISNDGDIILKNVSLKDIIPYGTTIIPNSIKVNESMKKNADFKKGINIGTIYPKQKVRVSYNVVVDFIRDYTPNLKLSSFSTLFYENGSFSKGARGKNKKNIIKSNKVDVNIASPNFKMVNLDGILNIAEHKHSIREILDVSVDIRILSKHVVKTPILKSIDGQILTGVKVLVRGTLTWRIEYVSDNDQGSIHLEIEQENFNTFIVLPQSYSSDLEKIDCIDIFHSVENINYFAIDERKIFKSVNVMLEANVK